MTRRWRAKSNCSRTSGTPPTCSCKASPSRTAPSCTPGARSTGHHALALHQRAEQQRAVEVALAVPVFEMAVRPQHGEHARRLGFNPLERLRHGLAVDQIHRALDGVGVAVERPERQARVVRTRLPHVVPVLRQVGEHLPHRVAIRHLAGHLVDRCRRRRRRSPSCPTSRDRSAPASRRPPGCTACRPALADARIRSSMRRTAGA